MLPIVCFRAVRSNSICQLPEKIDEVVFCPLSPKQIEVYKRILETPAVQNMVRKDEPCECGSKKPYVVRPFLEMASSILCRRKTCCHPYEKGDLFKYISTLIKISNHLALILPGESNVPYFIRMPVLNKLPSAQPLETPPTK